MSQDYDIIIIGGGMVGASLACALARSELRIAVVEAHPLRSHSQPSFDARAIALAEGSRRIFQGLGLWPGLADGVTPIERIHISDRGHFGVTHLDCREEGVPALGYVVENRVLGQALANALARHANIHLLCPARLQDLTPGEEHIRLHIEQQSDQREIRARLLIAADGANSRTRELLGLQARHWEYGQTAVISTVQAEADHRRVAYERFTDSGPLALLPLGEQRCSLVYTVRDQQVDELLGLDDAAFLQRLQQRFGYRLGRFLRAAPRHAYPLRLMRLPQTVTSRAVVIGNAAHALHPVAGQGFNLGIRDVAVLAELLLDAHRQGRDPGEAALLQRYQDSRRADYRRAFAFTDGLARLFSNPLPPLRLARSQGLLFTDLLPPIKHRLARQAMGLAGRLPRLARGLPL